ncbi:MAG: hypothetical protein RLZZ251_175 [Actinomycetota bacterium]|jgi:ribonuclease HII
MLESALLNTGMERIAGVDEAGRGACAGPLVVAAVMLKVPHSSSLAVIKDSKLLSPAQRERAFPIIQEHASSISIISISSEEIDRDGLHQSNLEGMRRAVAGLDYEPEFIFTDGYSIPGLSSPNLAVWKGDQVAVSISAASIIAKVTRDQIMIELDSRYPGYGLARHKGYGTRGHHHAIEINGLLPIHRRSYSNIARLLSVTQ